MRFSWSRCPRRLASTSPATARSPSKVESLKTTHINVTSGFAAPDDGLDLSLTSGMWNAKVAPGCTAPALLPKLSCVSDGARWLPSPIQNSKAIMGLAVVFRNVNTSLSPSISSPSSSSAEVLALTSGDSRFTGGRRPCPLLARLANPTENSVKHMIGRAHCLGVFQAFKSTILEPSILTLEDLRAVLQSRFCSYRLDTN